MGIENIIYLALGFLIASLLALVIMSRVWKRAVRITKKRLESDKPVTTAEILANKDQLRAEFALSTRQLEKNIENLREIISKQLAQISNLKNENAILVTKQAKQVEVNREVSQEILLIKEKNTSLQKQNADISQRLRMRERELNEVKAKSADLAKTLIQTKKANALNPAPFVEKTITGKHHKKASIAQTQISNASDHLNNLAKKSSIIKNVNKEHNSLAKDIKINDQMDVLKVIISDLENVIVKKDRYSSKKIMRNQMQEIASITSSIMNLPKTDNAQGDVKNQSGVGNNDNEISLFDKVQKFIGKNANDSTPNQ